MNPTNVSKHIMITGASSGIGKACAHYLDEKGFYVFAGVRSEAEGEVLRTESSIRLTPVLMDVCDSNSIGTAFDCVERSISPLGLYGLINNAGIASMNHSLLTPLSTVEKCFRPY